jgi:hypothetical protein
MICVPDGWTVNPQVDAIELVHPDGRDTAVIHYRERVRPLERLGTLVRGLLAGDPRFARAAVPPTAARLLTDEGEHAAQVTVRAPDPAAQRDLGFVFGDDFYALVDAVTLVPAAFDAQVARVRELVTTDRHMLGARRRRFEYRPPAQWQPLVSGFVTEWYPPNFPNDSVHITVYPANPVRLSPMAAMGMLRGFAARGGARVHTVDKPRPVRAQGDLRGLSVEALVRGAAPGTDGKRVWILLYDERYSYTVEATAGNAAHLAAHRDDIDGVVASAQPIPTGARAQDSAPILHWVD